MSDSTQATAPLRRITTWAQEVGEYVVGCDEVTGYAALRMSDGGCAEEDWPDVLRFLANHGLRLLTEEEDDTLMVDGQTPAGADVVALAFDSTDTAYELDAEAWLEARAVVIGLLDA